MTPKRTRTETVIRKHFGLSDTAELLYYNKGVKKDAQGNPLRGWFLNDGGTLRYLGRGVSDVTILNSVQNTTIIPRTT